MSSKLSRSMAGVRSAAAGWYIAKASAFAAPVAGSTGRTVPCACEIRAPGMNVPIESRPSVTTSAGSRTSSCRRRNGAQAAISSGCGSRLSGGRHLTTFVMKTSSRRQPIEPSSFTSRSPARPTNGRPWRSSLKPGPSPTNTTSVSGSPSPGTARVRVSWSRQRVQTRTSAAIASSAARRSASVTPWPRRLPGPRTGGRRGPRPGGPSRAREELGDLDRVRRRALAQVVGDDPEREPAIVRRSRGPGGRDRRRPRRVRRRRSPAGSVLGRVVLDDHARHRGEQLARPFRRDRLAGLDVDGLRVADEDRDADGRARDPQVRQVEDLAVLADDLPLLLRVAVGEEDVDLGQGVERDRVRVDASPPAARRRRARGSGPRARPARPRPVPDTDWYVSTTTRSRPTASRSAMSTGASCIVEQFGLAMIPGGPRGRPG